MIRFSKYIWLYVLISALVLVPGIFSLVTRGLKPSVDFTGGTLIELQSNGALLQSSIDEKVREASLSALSIQQSDKDSFIVRLGPMTEQSLTGLTGKLASISAAAVDIRRVESVGPVLGSELLIKAIIAALLAVVGILFYVAYAFRSLSYGLSAVIALIHDLLVVFGIFSLLGVWRGVEVDTLFVTAVLITMSFSVHDTIVVFHRIRELSRTEAHTPFADTANRALTETMGRSVTNSMTIVFMLLALILLGGENIRWFVMALLVGTISGTYSSPFVATPVLILWNRWRMRRDKKG